MSKTKSGGSTSNGRESQSKRLGVKLFGGQSVIGGNIIVRQRGTKFHAGHGVMRGGDDTLFAVQDGFIKFRRGLKRRTFIDIISTRA